MNASPIPRFAVRGMLYSLWAYLCTLGLAGLAYFLLKPGSIRTTLILTPVLTAVLIVGVTHFVYRASDEYIRQRILKAIAATAAIVAFATLGYFCLELFGYPRQSMIVVNLFGWAVFSVLLLYVILRSR